jgi:hypothetical protein
MSHFIERAFISFFRWLAALALATSLSLLLFIFFVIVSTHPILQRRPELTEILLSGWLILIGGAGVFVASLVMPEGSRRSAAWFFTLLGCAFYSYLWYSNIYAVRSGEVPILPFLPWLFGGGALSALYFAFRHNRMTKNTSVGRHR